MDKKEEEVKMKEYRHRLDLAVRDYECDLEGIVNNAVYMHYLEHARHEFLKTLDINFAEFSKNNINLVVIKAELNYKKYLTSGNNFWVGTNLSRFSPLRFAFYQDIYIYPDNQIALTAIVVCTAVNERKKPVLPEQLKKIFEHS